ncbi:uncharacterized protein VTP21DRAFT_9727 [Calcarisporiella thermophila]|uniref:uncharacterized protein n=1 Tax=Calcarisporiella thermophila TaxID=911321 RepID=UPI003744AF06
MSLIQKLAICGIRSFDPGSHTVIDFQSPLTLIVGPNGAGKTTIIECLKYATTGDLPPNSKGGAFIHDPKVADLPVVKAQIKLKFRSVTGQVMVCTRSLQLSQKRSKVEQKTLDGVLMTRDLETGEHVALGSRCAELDADLPHFLGVSRAILDNVIFCHQEESNWPLSEPSVLKKKFDEIFSSIRYTKAYDSIRTVRKEMVQELKLDQQKLDFLQVDRKRADKATSELEQARKNIARIEERSAKVESDLADVTHQCNELLEKYGEHEKIKARLDQLLHEKSVMEATLTDLEENFTPLNESEEELQKLVEEQRRKIESHDKVRSECEATVQEITGNITQLRRELSNKHTNQGRLVAELEAFDRHIQERVRVMRDVGRALGLDEALFSDDNVDAKQFTEQIEEQLHQQSNVVANIKKEAKEKEAELMKNLQSLNASIASIREVKKHHEALKAVTLEKVKDCTIELENLQFSLSESNALEDKLREEKASLEQAKVQFLTSDIEDVLQRKNRELREVDDAIISLNNKIAKLSRQSDTYARLGLMKSERERKKTTLRNLLAVCGPSFDKLNLKETEGENLEKRVEAMIKEKEEELTEKTDAYRHIGFAFTAANTNLNVMQSRADAMSKEQEEKKNRLYDLFGDLNLPEALKQVEEETQKYQEMFGQIQSAIVMYKSFLAKAGRGKNCPLCLRSFAKSTELDAFIKKLEDSLNTLPARQETVETQIQEFGQKRKRYMEHLHDWERVNHLSQKQALLREEASVCESRAKSLRNKLKKCDEEEVTAKRELSELLSLQKKVEECARLQREIRQLDSIIEDYESELSWTGSTKTIDEYQQEYDKLQDQGQALRRDIQRLHHEMVTQQRELSLQEARVRDASEQLSSMNLQFHQREQLQRTLQTLQDELAKTEEHIQEYDQQLAELTPQVEDLEERIQISRSEYLDKETKAQEELSRVQGNLDRLRAIEREIAHFTERDLHGQVDLCKSEVDSLEVELHEAATRLELAEKELSGLERRLSEVKNIERNVSDNLRQRHLQRELQRVQRELAELHEVADQYDFEQYSVRTQELQNRQSSLIAEKGSLQGELKHLEDQERKLVRELMTEYKDVQGKYLEQKIRVTLSETASQDLEKYAKALDNAIMRYHTMKMEAINSIIEELWVGTYQGNDIDRIEIRSDNEGVRAGSRSYNYRVVMIKGDTELDMRGRCSAGQKVLASIIIRLALAETFCVNCGILALDEPTTNLDIENVKRLAESLANIIKARRNQKNLQLVVITHDEDFLNMLGRSALADHYFRVYKDSRQCSVIEKRTILNDNNLL